MNQEPQVHAGEYFNELTERAHRFLDILGYGENASEMYPYNGSSISLLEYLQSHPRRFLPHLATLERLESDSADYIQTREALQAFVGNMLPKEEPS